MAPSDNGERNLAPEQSQSVPTQPGIANSSDAPKPKFFSLSRPRLGGIWPGLLSGVVLVSVLALLSWLGNLPNDIMLGYADYYDLGGSQLFENSFLSSLFKILTIGLTALAAIGLPLLMTWRKGKGAVIRAFVIELLVVFIAFLGMLAYVISLDKSSETPYAPYGTYEFNTGSRPAICDQGMC